MTDNPNPLALWATYSVRDHLDPNRFIADVLIYDHLLVPVPPKGEEDWWEEKGWQPALQRRLLDAIKEKDEHEKLLLELPWDKKLRKSFRLAYDVDSEVGPKSNAMEMLRYDLTSMKTEGRKDAPFHATAGVLAMLAGGNANNPIVDKFFARVSGDGAEPEPVLAYHSIDQLRREQAIGERVSLDRRRAEIAYSALSWKLDVPAPGSEEELDEEQLKAAVAFSLKDEWCTERKAFNAWVKGLANRAVDPEKARRYLEPQLLRLQALNKTITTRKRVHQVARFAVVPIAFTSLADPLIGLTATLADIGVSLSLEYFLKVPEIPAELHTAAYVQEAREFLATA